MRDLKIDGIAAVEVGTCAKLDDVTRVLSPKAMRCVRLAVAAVLGLQAMAVSWNANAQWQGPTITVYGDPIGWGAIPNSPGGGGWFWGGGRYETYIVDTWAPTPEIKVPCGQWDDSHPKPTTCDGPPPDVSTNGCGPGGALAIFGALYGDSFFSEACNVHDVCYSQHEANQEQCDRDLQNNMTRICEYAFGCRYDAETHSVFCEGTPAERNHCDSERQRILDDFFSPSINWVIYRRFETLQIEAKCRVWHNARANESDCEHP